MLQESIRVMAERIQSILSEPTIYLYGSVSFGDFRLGWSDIDLLVLAGDPVSEQQARELVDLRQRLTQEHDGSPYFRLFEGGMLSKRAFFSGENSTAVYWGTGGQRVTSAYSLDSFAIAALLDRGVLLCGNDIREQCRYPTHDEFRSDIRRHCHTMRQYAQTTGGRVTSCGWLLDIARGLYTLRTGKVIAKTAAGEWALAERLAPDAGMLRRAVAIRKDPLAYQNDPETLAWCAALGPYIQAFADVLERELEASYVTY